MHFYVVFVINSSKFISEIQSLSKLLASDHCNQRKLGLGHSLISTLLAANGEGISGLEGSGNVEPDQSQLESMSEGQQQAFHMRISLGDENTPVTVSTLGDFYGKLFSFD